MKRFITFSVLAIVVITVFGQAPAGINYQAVLRNSSGQIRATADVSIEISILQGSATGSQIFTETHTTETNDFGIVNLVIGSNNTSGFDAIDWADGPYFLNIKVDNTDMGTTQLLSVPYALHANTADSITGEIFETDPTVPTYIKDITNENINRWNESLLWGDHSKVGYLKYYNETDPVFASSAANGISYTKINYWNGKQDRLTAGTGIRITGNKISLSRPYYLGQDTLGGIVYYIYIGSDGLQHGLIVSIEETTAKLQNTVLPTKFSSTWNGRANTDSISDSPAKDWINANFSSEWYLPAIDELVKLFENRLHVNRALAQKNDPDIIRISNSSSYWSSTGISVTNSFYFSMHHGNIAEQARDVEYNVRAIRAF